VPEPGTRWAATWECTNRKGSEWNHDIGRPVERGGHQPRTFPLTLHPPPSPLRPRHCNATDRQRAARGGRDGSHSPSVRQGRGRALCSNGGVAPGPAGNRGWVGGGRNWGTQGERGSGVVGGGRGARGPEVPGGGGRGTRGRALLEYAIGLRPQRRARLLDEPPSQRLLG